MSHCPPRTLRLPPATCAGIQNVRVLGSGGGRDAAEARMPGRSDTVVLKAARAVPCEGCEGKQILRTFETYREAALLFDLMAQYGPDSVRLHGLCENRTDGSSSIVMEKLNISGAGLASWRKEVGEDQVKWQIRRYAERLGNFNAGVLRMHDSKWDNVGVNQRGQIHALDAGDFQIHPGPHSQIRTTAATCTFGRRFCRPPCCPTGSSRGLIDASELRSPSIGPTGSCGGGRRREGKIRGSFLYP